MSLSPLTISADKLSFLEDGKPWIWKGTLDWPLFGRFLNEGEAVTRAIFADRRSVGANIVCCAGMLSWWPGLHPDNPAYWQKLRIFPQIVADEGLRLCLVVFCDTRSLMSDRAAQLAHWDRIQAHLGDYNNVVFVQANQPGHPTQAITPEDTVQFTRNPSFPQLLTARNNPFEDNNPVLPALEFSCLSSSRDLQKYAAKHGTSLWYVVNGYQGADAAKWAGVHQATILFEPARIEAGPQCGAGAQDRNGWDNPGIWREIARNLSFKGTVGGNIYSRQGVNADLLTGVIRDCYVEYLGNIPRP